jgi:cytochrome c556
MKVLSKKLASLCISASLIIATSVLAQPAKSEKHANYTIELRQSIFKLLGSNMGVLGAMAKGKIPIDVTIVEKNAKRINQLSLMIADYSRTDTSTFMVDTEALHKIWQEPALFKSNTEQLTKASQKLIIAAQSKDNTVIKKAIGGVGKSCGGCHDNFKKD